MPGDSEAIERTITRASRLLDVPGYMVDREALQRIDEIARNLLAGSGEIESTFEIRTRSAGAKSQVFSSKDFGAAVARLVNEAARVESLSLRYAQSRSIGINVLFDSDGTVEAKGFSFVDGVARFPIPR